MKPIAILKMGGTLPEIMTVRGDFEEWIRIGMDLPREAVRVVEVFRGDPLPDPSSLAGAVITGSSAMVSEREDWSEQAAAWIPSLMRAEKPLLGICYGHQLIAHALGGRVDRNPNGREIGSAEVLLTADAETDALLAGLPRRLLVHLSHVEAVLELPASARLLGASELDLHQAFSVGPRTWGVQFHPEFDADVVRRYIAGRKSLLEQEGLDADALSEGVRESDHGREILRRFAGIAGWGSAPDVDRV